MTDEEFIELVGSELNVGICMNEVEKYRKGILNIAGKLNAENKKCKEIIKKIVVENFSCSNCKEIGLFAECQKREKSCETIVSEWFDKVMEQ